MSFGAASLEAAASVLSVHRTRKTTKSLKDVSFHLFSSVGMHNFMK